MNYEELRKKAQESLNIDFEISNAKKIPSLNTPALTLSGSLKKFSGAILFIDIRNSSSLPDKYDEIQLAQIINLYYDLMIQVAEEHNGEIKNCQGDGIMFIFKFCLDAVKAALDMQRVINNVLNYELNKIFFAEKIECGIGIDFGNILAMKVGTRGIENQGIVWPSSVTNTASKLADSAEADEIRITSSIYNVCSFISTANGSDSFNTNDWQYLKDLNCYASKYRAFRFNPLLGLNFDFAKAKADVQLQPPSLSSLSTASKLMGINSRLPRLAKYITENTYNISEVSKIPSIPKPELSLPQLPVDPFIAALESAMKSRDFPLQYRPGINQV